MANWSELQLDLIGEIAKKIRTVEDFVVFSRVCLAWRSAAIKEKNWVPSAQLPWLVLAESVEATEGENNRGFFSLYKNKRYKLDVPELCGCRIWGSSYGWVVAFGMDLQILMLNPLSRSKIYLPPQSTFTHQTRSPIPLTREWYRHAFIIKAVVLKRRPGEVMVAAIYGELNYLAIARPGDETWQEVESEKGILDIVCFDGQIFAVRCCGTLFLCEIDGPNAPKLTMFAPLPRGDYDLSGMTKLYLVESMGDLLMVVRLIIEKEEFELNYKTLYFDVFKLDFKTKEWTKLDNLGGRALFVGNNHSMSICSTEVEGCEGNCIYFTDDNCDQWCSEEERYGGHDIGVFNLEEYSVHPLPHSRLGNDNLRSSFSTPVWMLPSLF